MAKGGNLLSKTLVIGIILLIIVMSIIPSIAVDIVKIENVIGKNSGNDADWWPMFRHDLQHSGYSTSKVPVTNNVLWSYTIADYWNYYSVDSSPAVVDGRVHFVSSTPDYPYDSYVYCLDAITGGYIWSYRSEDGLYSSPAVADGRIYFGSHDRNVYCLDAITGDYIWSYETGSCVLSSPAVADGRVCFGSSDYNVYCLDAITGDYIWSYIIGDWVRSSPAVADGKVYIGSDDGNVYCLNVSTGDYIWSYKTGGDVSSSPAVADGKVYIGSDDGNVYCLNANTGDYIWRYKTGSYVLSSPAVADGKVYIGSYDGYIYCLDIKSGWYIWSYKTGGDVFSSPAVADGKVYIGSEYGTIYAFGEINPDSPSTPEIDGPAEGVPDVLYNFTFKSESTIGNDLFYWIEWADGSNSGWLGPFDSGVEITESHVWDTKGVYPIQAKVKDTNGSVSSWGILRLTIPRNRATVNSLFQLLLNRFPLLEVFIWIINLLR